MAYKDRISDWFFDRPWALPLLLVLGAIAYASEPMEGAAGKALPAVFLVLALVFLFATMSIALFLSVFASSQQVAILGSMIIFLFSGFFMSGLLIPFSLMGPVLKMEAFMFPTTHFVIISRSILVKGAGLAALQGFSLALLGLGAIFFLLTVLMFKKKL